MSTIEAPIEDRAYKFDADALARAWLGVAQASGKDDERPALSRTVLVEFYRGAVGDLTGVRLVATDGYVLLTAWVPVDSWEGPPHIDEAPTHKVIAVDSHGRGLGLMGHLRKIAPQNEGAGVVTEVTFVIGSPPKDPTETLEFEGIEQRALIISHPGHEELALPLFEGEYPEWRKLLGTHQPASTRQIALNPEIIARLGKLGKFYAEPLVWTFGGPLGAALIEIGPIFGAAMPMRFAGIEEEQEAES